MQVRLERARFLDYLYFTDFEANSPLSGNYGLDQTNAQTDCPYYWWSGDRDETVCGRISFQSGDVIDGDLHSNDTISVKGDAHFNGKTTTSMPDTICSGRRWWSVNAGTDGCGTPYFGMPVFSRSGDPAFQPLLKLPQTSGTLRTDADATGCIFVGPTQLTFNAAGTMTTVSPSRLLRTLTATTSTGVWARASRCRA